MKRKKDLIILLIPTLLILVLVLIKSFDKNSFSITAKETHELSIQQNHILSLRNLKTKLQSGEKLVLTDLRNKEDFKTNHLPGAINISMQEILKSAEIEKLEEETTLVLYSDSIENTTRAWVLLNQMGYPDLYILDISKEFITGNIFERDSFPLKDELLKYKFQPDTTIRLE